MDTDRGTGGQRRHEQVQRLGNSGPRAGSESDGDYWSISLSDDDQEIPAQQNHTPDRVDKVQPTHIQKGWIPPVSNFTMTLSDFPIVTVYLDFHRTSPSQ
jgi:hypothetical protein